MGTRYNRLDEAVLTSTHNLCFWTKIRKTMCTPVNPSFTIYKWGLRVSKLYRHVFVMLTPTVVKLILKGMTWERNEHAIQNYSGRHFCVCGCACDFEKIRFYISYESTQGMHFTWTVKRYFLQKDIRTYFRISSTALYELHVTSGTTYQGMIHTFKCEDRRIRSPTPHPKTNLPSHGIW